MDAQFLESSTHKGLTILGDQGKNTIHKVASLMALYTAIDEYELAKHLAYETMWFMEKTHDEEHFETQDAWNNVIIEPDKSRKMKRR